MAYLCVDENGSEWIFRYHPCRDRKEGWWEKSSEVNDCVRLPHGSIAKLIGRELTWEDEPYLLE